MNSLLQTLYCTNKLRKVSGVTYMYMTLYIHLYLYMYMQVSFHALLGCTMSDVQ